MPTDLLTAYLKLPVLALVVSRIAGVVLFLPMFSGAAVPMTLRALFVGGLALLVTPLVDIGPTTPTAPAAIAVAMGAELLIGMLIGLVVRAVFAGVQMGGMLIAQESGLAFGAVIDPTGMSDEESVVSVFYLQLAMVTFLILGGHRALLAATLDSFASAPLLHTPGAFGDWLPVVTDALRAGFELSVRVAAPTVLALFLVNIVLGFLSRTVPQLNVMVLGFTLKTLLAFLIMAVTLPAALTAFTGMLDEVVGWLPGLWN